MSLYSVWKETRGSYAVREKAAKDSSDELAAEIGNSLKEPAKVIDVSPLPTPGGFVATIRVDIRQDQLSARTGEPAPPAVHVRVQCRYEDESRNVSWAFRGEDGDAFTIAHRVAHAMHEAVATTPHQRLAEGGARDLWPNPIVIER